MQKWLTQAALRTTTDDIIDFSEYSSLFVKKKEYSSLLETQGNWTNKPELRHQE